ncbi:MAG: hypothetical protein E7J72_05475, partial [Veillonella sp.]|nr:hypothetical protein [Veillonella sp.]
NTLFKQQVENKTANIIDKALGYGNDFTKFRQDGALFWEAGQLHASLTDQKKTDLVSKAITEAHESINPMPSPFTNKKNLKERSFPSPQILIRVPFSLPLILFKNRR